MKIAIPIALALTFTTSGVSASPAKNSAARPQDERPLTLATATSFFREALGRRPLKVDARTAVFAEGEWKSRNVYNHSLIFIENADEDVQITFIMTGDEGMNWVNEFFDSLFFSQRETDSLFALLNRGVGTRRATLGAFQVELSRWEPRHHEIVALSFTRKKLRLSAAGS